MTLPALLLAAAYLLLTASPASSVRLRSLRAVAAPLPARLHGLASFRTGARDAAAVTAALPELCRAAAAELRSGAPPPLALSRAAAEVPPALAAHVRRLAADPGPPADWAALRGAEQLRALGALWSVAADAGSGLADGLDRLAASLAAEQRRRADVAAQLAGPKASAAVLAVLPLCGVALAASLGARPVAFLTRTPYGIACLVAAILLDAAGVWWVRRITRAALR